MEPQTFLDHEDQHLCQQIGGWPIALQDSDWGAVAEIIEDVGTRFLRHPIFQAHVALRPAQHRDGDQRPSKTHGDLGKADNAGLKLVNGSFVPVRRSGSLASKGWRCGVRQSGGLAEITSWCTGPTNQVQAPSFPRKKVQKLPGPT